MQETRNYAANNFGFGGRLIAGRRSLVIKVKDRKTGSWSRARLEGDGEKMARFLAGTLSPIALEALQKTLQDLARGKQ